MISFESSVRYIWDDLNNIEIWMINKNVWRLISKFVIYNFIRNIKILKNYDFYITFVSLLQQMNYVNKFMIIFICIYNDFSMKT